MKIQKTFLVAALLASIVGCNSNKGYNLAESASGDMEAYENGDVHAVEQARPTIMIFPSDNLLKNTGALKQTKIDGRTVTLRDYEKFFANNKNIKQIISIIQKEFTNQNYPLTDLEQTLKHLNTKEAVDIADDLDKDAKTMLLTTAHPDIILELNYNDGSNGRLDVVGHNYDQKEDKISSYTINAIDCYTSKVVATIQSNDIKGNSIDGMKECISADFENLAGDIQSYFSDILRRGREITVRISVENGAGVNLSDESIEGDTYSDWIIDYVKSHTIKGAYKMETNTDKEISFVGCRIKLLNDDGTQYGVYDWTRDFCKNLRKNLGLKVANQAQGLGEVQIKIKGI